MKSLHKFFALGLLSTTILMADGPAGPAAQKAEPAPAPAPAAVSSSGGRSFDLEGGVLGGFGFSRIRELTHNPNTGNLISSTTVNASGALGGAFLRSFYMLPNQFVVGLQLHGSFSGLTGHIDVVATTAVYKFRQDYSYGADLLFGRDLGGYTPFLKVGYIGEHLKFTYVERNGANPDIPVTKKSMHQGLAFGVGVRMKMTEKLFMGLEVGHHIMNRKTYLITQFGGERFKIKPTTTQAVLKFSYKFM